MTRSLTLMLALIASGSLLQAQVKKQNSPDVPDAAKTEFASAFPSAKHVKWEKEHGGYEVNFYLDKKEMSAVYDKTGQRKETEESIAISDLSPDIVSYVHKNYPAEKIKDAAKITKTDGTIVYEAGVGKSDILFDSNGKFISKQKD